MIRASLPNRFSVRHLGVWFIIVTLLATTLLHYLTNAHLIPYHSLYRSLYYIPLAVAAVRYGRRGGILTAVVASVFYIPHIVLSLSTMPNDAFNDLLETVIFLFFTGIVGSLADAERDQRRRAQEAAAQLVATNAELHVQVTLAEQMRASISSILESIDSGVVTLTDDGQITTCNRAAKVFLDWDQDTPPSLSAVIQDYVTTTGRGYRQLRVAGHVLGVRGSPLIGAHGERIGTVVVLDDVTELRALEEQVQRAQHLAALGRLAGGLAHEIRNPLGITRAAAQMLQRTQSDDSTLAEYTHVIQTEIDRVDRLVEQLLAYARPRPLQHGPIDVLLLLDGIISLIRPYATQQQVSLVLSRAHEVPLAKGDAELLHQAIVNMLLNGIQASPAGARITITVEQVVSEHHGDGLRIIIRDEGHGIAPEDLARIFDPFFTTRDGGIGLGLSIVQQIIAEHQGQLDVQSELGKGTQCIISLPTYGEATD